MRRTKVRGYGLPHCRLQSTAVAYLGIFFFRGGGVQQIQLRTEDRENRDLGVAAP
jgi:hypothetical protein